jgi:hypothetical protein
MQLQHPWVSSAAAHPLLEGRAISSGGFPLLESRGVSVDFLNLLGNLGGFNSGAAGAGAGAGAGGAAAGAGGGGAAGAGAAAGGGSGGGVSGGDVGGGGGNSFGVLDGQVNLGGMGREDSGDIFALLGMVNRQNQQLDLSNLNSLQQQLQLAQQVRSTIGRPRVPAPQPGHACIHPPLS